MASIIPGYENDIFISYRQKDNKHDGWVTEFVDNLKGELESTFKEEISVYFDINPHDGILETYNVDASLKEKLKCLVFIPIISQTYCDTNSYAWQNEFVTFNRRAKGDSYGINIRLRNGNVASRILPILIHDIDSEDRESIENELNSPLRAIEFIYKEFGVNRPLTPSDNPDKNQERTYYRDQLNKVANTIKAIITSLKNPIVQIDQKTNIQQHKSKSLKKLKYITIALSIIFLCSVFWFLVYPKLISVKQNTLVNSIAVLYFENISSDPEQQYFSDGITEEITSHLSMIKGLRVTSRTSVIPYKGKGKALNVREIAKQLNVSNVLEGSVRKSGDRLRITAELIDARIDQLIWTEVYDRDLVDIFKIQSEIAHSIAEKFKIKISPEANTKIGSIPTNNIRAYELYLKARSIPLQEAKGIGIYNGSEDKAVSFLKEAINLDPDFSQPYALWSQIYFSRDKIDSAIILSKEAIIRNPKSTEGYIALASTQDFENALKTMSKVCTIDSTMGLLNMASLYTSIAKFPEAVQCYLQVNKINRNLYQSYLGMAFIYYYLAQPDSMDKYEALSNLIEPNSKDLIQLRVFRAQFMGQPDIEIKAAKEYYGDDTLNCNYKVGMAYLFARNWKRAESYYARTFYRDIDWGLILIKTGRRDSGIMVLKKSLAFRGVNGWPGDLSRINAVLGNTKKAITEFQKLIESGWYDLNWMRNDPFWDYIRLDAEFKKNAQDMENRKNEMLMQIKENKSKIFSSGY
jgi:TolB-like protein